jgi:hypothetical protein
MQGFETERSCFNAKAQALTGYAAHGSAGSAEAGWKEPAGRGRLEAESLRAQKILQNKDNACLRLFL